MTHNEKKSSYDHYLPKTRNELERRLALMESEDYPYPPRLKKGDWLGFLLVVLVCLAVVCGLKLYCATL